ncbi:enoyl-CoA hydratase [Streptococcus hillyeri]|uniref:Enoyl-CoA hydratase n=1 Tax=Streptococcus hillyeri TaxID=2282420 RepID=A0A3L9DS48_9STRE|nr:enoyl-CoA hydratase [Streptococcus hillyeri]RLY03785.1 enoyl-CoA hydratase [Streptococcus hillyeri]
MNFQTILYDVSGDLATVTFNRPEVSNGFNIPMCEEILTALKLAEEDSSVRLVLIRAEGKVFSVGGDLSEMQRAVESDDIQSLVDIAKLVQDISYQMKRLPKPVIMAVDGPVAGAAFNMVLAADFCVASEKSKFIQAFVNVGLAPDAGGLYLLMRAVGMNKATHLVMTGEAVTAEKALDYGFVYKTCLSEKLETTTQQLIKRLKRGSFNSYRAMKELVWQSFFSGWKEYAGMELKLQEALAFKEDFKEGVKAYSERRRPNFSGEW